MHGCVVKLYAMNQSIHIIYVCIHSTHAHPHTTHPHAHSQNSGFGNCVNPLLSMADSQIYSIPMLLLIGWRGEPGTYNTCVCI
jgi:hypothetical protein